jgi:hypothetical protein
MDILIGQIPTRDEQRIIAQPATPIIPAINPDRGWADTGTTIFVCLWILRQGWALFTQMQGAESKMTQALIAAVLEQNKILISALVKREP